MKTLSIEERAYTLYSLYFLALKSFLVGFSTPWVDPGILDATTFVWYVEHLTVLQPSKPTQYIFSDENFPS